MSSMMHGFFVVCIYPISSSGLASRILRINNEQIAIASDVSAFVRLSKGIIGYPRTYIYVCIHTHYLFDKPSSFCSSDGIKLVRAIII